MSGSREKQRNFSGRNKAMNFTVLSDNNGTEQLTGEWGLSILIDFDGLNILLDAGASGLFLKNARLLGKDLRRIDIAVLSHAHYDHADGFVQLLRENPELKVYIRRCAEASCYALKESGLEYIGVAPALVNDFEDRLTRVDGDCQIAENIWLIPHKCQGRTEIGIRERMFVRAGEELIPDDFSHEQSLVFQTKKGLCIFNSCSHAGASEIIEEIRQTFPGERVYAYIGGFHLYRKTEEEVRRFAERLKAENVEKICTGHCTGDAACAILKEQLGERITQFHVGLEMEL